LIKRLVFIALSSPERVSVNQQGLSALKELAVDFDKGGFINKAIETYKDVLKD
jgi:hypothetical protein